MTVGHPTFGTMCEICYTGLTADTCVVDTDGVKWDICPGICAWQAGIREAPRHYSTLTDRLDDYARRDLCSQVGETGAVCELRRRHDGQFHAVRNPADPGGPWLRWHHSDY